MEWIAKWIRRKRQSKGYGVHSPFAFHLITHVIHHSSRYDYYASDDIKLLLNDIQLDIGKDESSWHNLCLRLTYHFKPKRLLEINSGLGINTLYITSSTPDVYCICIENDIEKRTIAQKILSAAECVNPDTKEHIFINDKIDNTFISPFDAIFINLSNSELPSIENLISLSHDATFWVIFPINRGRFKQFWKNIVNHERIRITFSTKQVGIVFLDSSYHKLNYLI